MRDLHTLNERRKGGFTLGYLFFMGAARHGGDPSYEEDAEDELAEREATAFGDVLRLDVVDSYLNLTRKVVAVNDWVTQHCKKAGYLLKTDDGLSLNIPRFHSQHTSIFYTRVNSIIEVKSSIPQYCAIKCK